jgi:hypothetical protein
MPHGFCGLKVSDGFIEHSFEIGREFQKIIRPTALVGLPNPTIGIWPVCLRLPACLPSAQVDGLHLPVRSLRRQVSRVYSDAFSESQAGNPDGAGGRFYFLEKPRTV